MKVEVIKTSWGGKSIEDYLKPIGLDVHVVTEEKEFDINGMTQKYTETTYYIELETLEQLVELKTKLRLSLVLLSSADYDFCIEIYDDYRE